MWFFSLCFVNLDWNWSCFKRHWKKRKKNILLSTCGHHHYSERSINLECQKCSYRDWLILSLSLLRHSHFVIIFIIIIGPYPFSSTIESIYRSIDNKKFSTIILTIVINNFSYFRFFLPFYSCYIFKKWNLQSLSEQISD